MPGRRATLQEALCRYTTDTFTHIDTVSGFCEGISTWANARREELIKLRNIKEKESNLALSFSHVTKSKKKFKALWAYLKSHMNTDSKRAELEKELAAVLEDTLTGFEELDSFQDAVEKLAVTSLPVFMEKNQVLRLPEGISLEHVRSVINAVQLICPRLLEFKRDARVFFLPKLQNVEVLSYQLEKYIETTRDICDKLEKCQRILMTPKHLRDLGVNLSDDDAQTLLSHLDQQFESRLRFQRPTTETVVNLAEDLSDDEIQRMLSHINQLHEIRMDAHFRLEFLFQKVSSSDFISEFEERQPRMLEFLKKLEEAAVQLDEMNKGARISGVVGSSVGAVGGVLSIVGLALIPVTAGVSAGLIIGGAALGITSAVNSGVTTLTEIGVNSSQQGKASGVFEEFMKDVQGLQGCLEKVSDQPVTKIMESEIDVLGELPKVFNNVRTVGKATDFLLDAASTLTLVGSEEVAATAAVVQKGAALRNMPKAASEIPDIGQAAVKAPLALSKAARAGLIGANALFLGLDIAFICKDSYSLSKGSETEVSKSIRARAALWSSEIDSWKKIHDSLCKSQKTSEEHKSVLKRPFYPERQI